MKIKKNIIPQFILTLSYFKLKVFLVFTILVCAHVNSIAQEVSLNVIDQPLSKVLVELSDKYNIQLSFNHALVSECKVTVTGNFNNPEQAISHLIQECEFDYEYSNGVYIVFKAEVLGIDTVEEVKYYYSGQLIDALSQEPLPYSSIQLNDYSLMADASGNFALNTTREITQMQVSHLGYYVLDTIINPGSNQRIKLTPAVVGLHEIVVNSDARVYTTSLGERPGLIKLNKKVASFLPGNNNNTLFNLLRLQPGILATAEKSGDYIVWGSYRGQTLLQFDGIPLFSSNSLNNEIGIVNPLIVSDVEVFKAGYNVDRGDRVGGIVEMTGAMGDSDNFSGNVNVNSQTVSGKINIPIAQKFALQAAFRQSYYSVIDWNEAINGSSDKNDYYVPEYQFQDMNLKFTGRFNSGDNFYVSLIGNNDNSLFDVTEESYYRGKAWENTVDKQQLGIGAGYTKTWNQAGVSEITIAYSDLTTETFDRINSNRMQNGKNPISETYYRENTIVELAAKIRHDFAAAGMHQFNVGVDFVSNNTEFAQDTVPIVGFDKDGSHDRVSFYLKDNLSLTSWFSLQAGIKADFIPELNKSFALPRINALLRPHEKWNINLAWGMYNQYITEMALFDRLGNSYYFWGISDGSEYNLQTAVHYVLGTSFKYDGLKIGIEGFYKTTEGLSRVVTFEQQQGYRTINGDSRAYGLDFYLKETINKHDFWIAYSLSKTEELFGKQNIGYQLAPQDQRHEVKIAGILNFNPWYFSTNYVFGSGLESSIGIKGPEVVPYHRLDAALLYKFNTDKFNLETGFSIVNVLNYDNVGLTNFSKLPDNKITYSQGIPFTPSIFVNIGF